MSKITLDLKAYDSKRKLYYNEDYFNNIIEEFEHFLDQVPFIKNPDISKHILFPYEIKSNNAVEGYNENIEYIIEVLNKKYKDKNKIAEYRRVSNLIKGYKYILTKPEINEDNLKHLYTLLSAYLLEPHEYLEEDKYYRNNDVYIYFSDNVAIEPDKGIDTPRIKEYMDYLFEYINSDNSNLSDTEKFIKSQIIHYYFVYIHPYFDINGRISRTTSIWYLNNNEAYPFTMFNRGITLDKSNYYKAIRSSKKYCSMNPFLRFMLENTKIKFEHEYLIQMIDDISNQKIDVVERQTLEYILSMNSNLTFLDFVTFYKRFNPHRDKLEIQRELLDPLIEKGILIKGKNSSKIFNSIYSNYFFTLNEHNLDVDLDLIRRVDVKKYTKERVRL